MSMTISSIATNKMQDSMLKISTGNRINTAANDAAGLAIAEKLTSQVRGYEQGIKNTEDMNNLVRTAESGLSNVSEGMQRMRELSVQAANGTLSESDRKIIQEEINQIKGSISDVVKNTEFNGQKLLTGSFANKNTASQPNGTGVNVSIPNVSLQALGIENYDVTKQNFDMSQLDMALEKVTSARSELGALSNTFQHTINSNAISSLNLAASRSRIQDTDIAKSVSDVSKNRLMEQFQIMMQRKEQDNAVARRSVAPTLLA